MLKHEKQIYSIASIQQNKTLSNFSSAVPSAEIKTIVAKSIKTIIISIFITYLYDTPNLLGHPKCSYNC